MLRTKHLPNKDKRQESARAGLGTPKNVKKSGDPVTLPPNPLKLSGHLNGAKVPRRSR